MPLVCDEMENKSIKKTLTIPKWLNDAAEKRHINYSHVLQESLKHHLGITDHHMQDNILIRLIRLCNSIKWM